MQQSTGAIICLCVATALASPLPHTKIVVAEPSEINTIGKGEVGASWGGYSASAGLGGGPNGGGLHAEASAPGHAASAGLGGGAGAEAGAGGFIGAGAGSGGGQHGVVNGGGSYGGGYGGGQGGGQGGGFFDNIFNIPISVLKAVNTYLNQKGPTVHVEHPPHHHGGHHESESGAGAAAVSSPGVVQPSKPAGTGSHSGSFASAESGAVAGAGAGSGASAGAGHAGGVHVQHTPNNGNYDQVFNIPISALKSVNQLLNG